MIKKTLCIKDYQDFSYPETWGSLISNYSKDTNYINNNIPSEDLHKLDLIYSNVKGFEKGGYHITGYNIDYLHPRLDLNVINTITFLDLGNQMVSGTVKNIVFSEYEVKTYVKTDAYYENSTYQIDDQGNWGGNILYGIQPNLSARLIRKKGNIEVDRTGEQNIDYSRYFFGTFIGFTGSTSDYAIDVYAVSDTSYFIERIYISDDGHWGGYYPQIGGIFFTVKKISTNEIMCETYQSIGLLRSYNIPESDEIYSILNQRCFIYDQAVAVIAACIMQKEYDAERWVKGILNVAYDDGQYAFSYQSVSGNKIDPYFRNGAQFWVFIALMFFLEKFPLNQITSDVEEAVIKGLNSMISDYWVTGDTLSQYTFTMGKGLYSPDYQTFYSNYKSTVSSTENNIDAYFAYKMAFKYFNNQIYLDIVKKLENSLLVNLWDNETKRAFQGVDNGVLDYSHALDCSSWYAIMAYSAGDTIRANEAINSTELYKINIDGATGFKPYIKELGYPDAIDTIWIEGTCGVILGYQSIGNIAKSNYYWDQMYNNLKQEDGFLYVTTPVVKYEMKDWVSLISTSWMIISKMPSGFWDTNQTKQLLIGSIPILLTERVDDLGYFSPLVDDWQKYTYYNSGDTILYNNISYVSLVTHFSGSDFNELLWTKNINNNNESIITYSGETKINQFRRFGKTDNDSDLYNPYWNTGFTQIILSNNTFNQIVGEKDNDSGLNNQKLYDYNIWISGNTGTTMHYSDVNDTTSVISFNSNGFNTNNSINSPKIKLDYLIGIINPPKIEVDVNIDRGENSSFQKHLALGDIRSLTDLIDYGNGFFNIKEN